MAFYACMTFSILYALSPVVAHAARGVSLIPGFSFS
jgi:hypothetical protein